MKIIPQDSIDYNKIAQVLQNGGVIIYPTDTAYALGCDAENQNAINTIFKIKNREFGKTLPLIVADTKMVGKWANLSKKAKELIQKYWPGALTLVLLTTKQHLSTDITAEGYIAIRVPNSEVATKISQHFGNPIVSTSANKSGDQSTYTLEHAIQSLGNQSELVVIAIDAGELRGKGVSTIAKVWDTKVEILRKGVTKID